MSLAENKFKRVQTERDTKRIGENAFCVVCRASFLTFFCLRLYAQILIFAFLLPINHHMFAFEEKTPRFPAVSILIQFFHYINRKL